MSSNKTIIANGRFLVPGSLQPVLSGYMTIEDDLITYIGEDKPAAEDGVLTVDGSRLLFMPGLVNTHGHAAMSLLRGYGDDMVLQSWLQEKMWPMEAKFTGDDVYWGTALSVLEMLKGGTTTFLDMYDHMDRVAEVTEQSGIRAVLMRGAIGLCPEDVQNQKLAEAVEFARNWHGKADGRITAMLSPHAPYTCPPDFFMKFVQAAHDLDLPMHTHMSETRHEVEQNVADYGLRPVAHLEKLGMFTRPSLIAHGVHLNDEEIEILAKYNVGVSHNPGSNLKLASGVARVPDLLRAGVKVSLGTDGAASNNNLDMFEEMRLAALIHKGVSGDPTAVPAPEALLMATEYGAASIYLNNVGRLAAGMKADFIAIDIDQPHLLPHSDLLSHAVYSASAKDVEHVWVNGKQVVKHGQCLTLDEEEVRRKAQETFESLLKR
ncbi:MULTISPECIES: amidohydrolase [unclassified Paenibacillus]|uniref:amidohydrolase n=1 Tax=unclassified Paenibacillus TaxID=185978 RepID=UPI0024064BDA|nr:MULTISPECIES: amidohydrolase [unclassified Paenibacillus]MDF9840280.1 5-methylthioadenosine/S-adenosylhomocysteine deaminase [Paenibacillus sp. PastF-2]MDF9846862.1 5-methylthioadenosine/S-adenosylhomocysteine deaminase [Paenibacillus sp. PastM-2]MDF9853434.1 5-methylthioadenosine/S-adenosylhomocysteine deaminase [Paenibacillus sp. PastF-1]MDH6479079.1 5-methylthioadenosine/S-adenosylhomocysteine deaminase [Paenibacillus sp. PastH-2]MDH6506811.1 5-methylthioadenosine/S-adenosylhomocysteine 